MNGRYVGKRVLVTCLEKYMGQVMADAFGAEGAEVITDNGELVTTAEVEELQRRAGHIDILIANFAEDPYRMPVADIEDEAWQNMFEKLVHPLMRVVRAFTPAMVERGSGKVIAITSAAPLRGIPKASAYCAARGAQNAFVRAVGLELAPHNVQANAIAQNFVKNERYYPDWYIESDKFKENILPTVPSAKVAEPEETAELALYLASDKCTHMVGQVIPWAGGWVTST
jgi:2-keto-3-deoxy-L-fuconate dehydrogenase